MIKDRFGELKALLVVEQDNDEVQLSMENDAFLVEFFAQTDDIRANINKIQLLIEQVNKLHDKILSTPSNQDKFKNELDERMGEIKRMALIVRQKLKDMDLYIGDIEENSKDALKIYQNVSYRIKKTQYTNLSYVFKSVMAYYNKVQVDFRESCKKRIIRQLEITGREIDKEELEEMLESGDSNIFTQGIILEAKIAKQTLAEIEARHKDILKLEKSIQELHEMFMDMAMIVETQGDMVDNIERAVSLIKDSVESSKVETTKAVEFKKSARRVSGWQIKYIYIFFNLFD